jgi:predicted O-methyltransferase YrrM
MREANTVLVPPQDAALSNRNGFPEDVEFECLLDELFAESRAFPWSTERETGAFLASLVRLLRPQQVLELGTFKGATTLQFIRALDVGKPRVVTVDCTDLRSPALRKLDPYYSFVLGQDLDVVPTLMTSFDFIYLDTLHTYEHTKSQIAIVRAHQPHAVLAVHDVLSFPDVARALAEFTSEYSVLSLPTPPQPGGRVNGVAILAPKN